MPNASAKCLIGMHFRGNGTHSAKFDVTDLEQKVAGRGSICTRSFAEKIFALDGLRDRAGAFRAATGQSDGTRSHRGGSAGYAAVGRALAPVPRIVTCRSPILDGRQRMIR